jgi:hypothetical protein
MGNFEEGKGLKFGPRMGLKKSLKTDLFLVSYIT